MARLSLAAAVLTLVVPALGLADGKKPAPSPVIPASMIGEAKPASCNSCGNGSGAMVLSPGQTGVYSYPPGTFGARLDRQLWWDEHECAPDGCLKPIGCGNHWTEFKFIFGSCRQFFGTAWSAEGHGRTNVERR